MFAKRRRDLESNAELLACAPDQVFAEQGADLLHLVVVKRMEHQNFVDAVDKLGPEHFLYFFHDTGAHFFIGLLSCRLIGKSQRLGFKDPLRPDIGRHDDHSVLEIDLVTLRIRDVSLVQDLQKDIEDISVRFLDLIEQNDAVGMAPHLLGKLSALFITDISRR